MRWLDAMELMTRCSLLFLFLLGLNGCGTSDDISGVYTEIDSEEFPIEIALLELSLIHI